MLYQLLILGLGGAAGSMARYLLSYNVLAGYSVLGFPAGTFAVNVIGSFLIGMFMSLMRDSNAAQLFFVTGLCGGFTTFSTFSADTVKLLRLEKWDAAAFYIFLSVIIAFVCTAAGMWLGTVIRKIFA